MSLIVETPVCPLSCSTAQSRVVTYASEPAKRTTLKSRKKNKQMTMIGFGSGKMWTQKSYQVDDPMWCDEQNEEQVLVPGMLGLVSLEEL